MGIIGTNLAGSLAGLNQAEKAAVVEKTKEAARPRLPVRARQGDELDLPVTDLDAAGALRDLKGNGEEETHEDRQQHPQYKGPRYGPDGALLSKDDQQQQLDLNG